MRRFRGGARMIELLLAIAVLAAAIAAIWISYSRPGFSPLALGLGLFAVIGSLYGFVTDSDDNGHPWWWHLCAILAGFVIFGVVRVLAERRRERAKHGVQFIGDGWSVSIKDTDLSPTAIDRISASLREANGPHEVVWTGRWPS